MTQFSLTITDKGITVQGKEQPTLLILNNFQYLPALSEKDVLVYVSKHAPVAVGIDQSMDSELLKKSDQLVVITASWDSEKKELAEQLVLAWLENGQQVVRLFEPQKIPSNHLPTVTANQEQLFSLLSVFGIDPIKKKKASAKAQHRWKKSFSDIPFYVTHEGATGTVFWQKRNELLLKKGAVLKAEVPLNKDGSVGFSARFAEKLRQEHLKQIDNFVTTEDILFKSVNEIGLFLYFAGTNSWLVLKDEGGKTINDYSLVK